jgi:hypothetical protein
MSIPSVIPYFGDAKFDVVKAIELRFGALGDRCLDPRQSRPDAPQPAG